MIKIYQSLKEIDKKGINHNTKCRNQEHRRIIGEIKFLHRKKPYDYFGSSL